MSATEKIYFYPVWLRIWHGFNALGIIALIFTGISMQSSIESAQVVGFNMVVNIHNIAGVGVTLSYFVYFIGNMITPNGKYYIIKPQGFLKKPMIYIIVMYMAVPIVIITGIALLFPEIIIEKVYTFSGVFVTAILHSSMGFFISIFLVIHIYIASIGKSPLENFKSIINGWHHVH